MPTSRRRRPLDRPSRAGGVKIRPCGSPRRWTTRCAPRSSLAAAGDGPTKGEQIAQAQDIPLKFLENILLELRHGGLVQSQRGAEGGYWLARPPEEIKLADVIRAVEGPLANVRGSRPEAVAYEARRRPQDVRIAMREPGAVLEELTLADVAGSELPPRSSRSRHTLGRGSPTSGAEDRRPARPDIDDLALQQLQLLDLVPGHLRRDVAAVVQDSSTRTSKPR